MSQVLRSMDFNAAGRDRSGQAATPALGTAGSVPADARGGRGAHAVDDDLALFVFGAVVVDLAPVVHDEAAGRHRLGAVRIEFLTRSRPPGSRNDKNEPVVRMKVRPRKSAWRKPVANGIGAGLVRVTIEHRSLEAGIRRAFTPLRVGRQFVAEH